MESLTLQQAAAFLKIHPVTLQEKARAGEIPGAKIGKCWVFLEIDLVDYVRLRIPVKLDSDSTPSWTRIPEQAGQSERSDAGFGVFTLLMSWGSSFCRAA